MRVRRSLWAGLVLVAGTVGSYAQWTPAHNTDAGVKPVGEFIYPPATVTPECHASTIVALKNGDLLAAWFGGAHERAPDVAIYTARMHNGAWSKPVEVARETEGRQGRADVESRAVSYARWAAVVVLQVRCEPERVEGEAHVERG